MKTKKIMMAGVVAAMMLAAQSQEVKADTTTQVQEADEVAISKENFPDKAFCNIIKTYDTDGDGMLSDKENQSITEIGREDIADYSGIEHLKYVESFINFSDFSEYQFSKKAMDVNFSNMEHLK